MTEAWSEGGLPLTSEAIDQAARSVGGPMPPELRRFYARHNGGWPDDESLHPLGVHGYVPIGTRLTDAEQLAADLCEEQPSLRGLFPFAYDAGGNTFFVSLRAADHGALYVYLHQEDDVVRLECDLADLLPGG